MSVELTFRKATPTDLVEIKNVLDQARKAQREQGFRQWDDGYPSREAIAADITAGTGYVLADASGIAAYSAIGFSDSEYDRLEYIWQRHGPYGVIHRTGIADRYRGRHLSVRLFDECEDIIRQHGAEAVRIDTGVGNRVMLHILAGRGYADRGLREFIWGERVALEKTL